MTTTKLDTVFAYVGIISLIATIFATLMHLALFVDMGLARVLWWTVLMVLSWFVPLVYMFTLYNTYKWLKAIAVDWEFRRERARRNRALLGCAGTVALLAISGLVR